MANIPIIDPHIHLWHPKENPKQVTPLIKAFGWSPWLLDKVTRMVMPKSTINFVGKSEYFLYPHLPVTYHRDTGKYKIDGFVHIQAGWEGEKPFNSIGETEWLMSLEQRPLAIVGEAHLRDVETLDAVLDAHQKASPLFRGVRDMIAEHPAKNVMDFCESKDMLKSDKFKEGYNRLGQRNLTFDAYLYSHQLPDFIKLVEEVPDTKVVLDHVGTPVGVMGPHGGVGATKAEQDKIKKQWYEDLAKLADVPHVHLKLSGLLMTMIGHQFEKREEPASVSEVVDAIGPHITYALSLIHI